jgi:hypothetical protein
MILSFKLNSEAWHKMTHLIGLHHQLDGITNPEYKLMCFIQLSNFLQIEEGTSFES